jgi:hypothetical protein
MRFVTISRAKKDVFYFYLSFVKGACYLHNMGTILSHMGVAPLYPCCAQSANSIFFRKKR